MIVWNIAHDIATDAVSGVDAGHGSELNDAIAQPAAAIRRGRLVAFPTETVYGLGADATSEAAVQRIFQAKGRPADNPLIVHIADAADWPQVAAPGFSPSEAMARAMAAFWPGPLTVIVPVHPNIAPSIHPQMDTVGVRVPNHPIARALIRQAGCPIAAPSANQSGRPSPTTAQDVLDDYRDGDANGYIDGVVDGGSCTVGLESTVVAFEPTQVVIYRPGGVTKAALETITGLPVVYDAHLTAPTAHVPKSPGMKYQHYAPDAQVHVWWGAPGHVNLAIADFRASLTAAGNAALRTAAGTPQQAPIRIAVMAPSADVLADVSLRWTPPSADEPYEIQLGRALYRQLRAFDRAGASHILVVGVAPDTDAGAAVMNRLDKASGGRVQAV